jgi:predicted nucleotidyltransferase
MDYSKTMSSPSEMWLFGSAARGDMDELSDVDILVAGAPCPRVLDRLPYSASRLSIVRYGWEELAHMAAYGSLFLHHVRLEGRPLQPETGPRLRELLEKLPPYHRADHELGSFRLVLDDVEESLAGEPSLAFELSVIATALRHSCILGCYVMGCPTFGRRSAFQTFLEHCGLGGLASDAERLYEFRLYEDERAAAPFGPTAEDARVWLERARIVVDAVAEALDER